jgi:hypothetical protein
VKRLRVGRYSYSWRWFETITHEIMQGRSRRMGGKRMRMKAFDKMEVCRSRTKEELASTAICNFMIFDKMWKHEVEDVSSSKRVKAYDSLPKRGG